MALKVTKVDVWAVEFPDEPGALAKILVTLAEAARISNASSPAGKPTSLKPALRSSPR